jgi:hypothetical protein
MVYRSGSKEIAKRLFRDFVEGVDRVLILSTF